MATSEQKYLNSQPGSHDDQLAERKLLRDMEDAGVVALGSLDDSLEEIYIRIPVNDGSGWQSNCKIVRLKATSPSNQRPLIIMFHGGGWRRGSPEMFTRPAREFALAFDAVVVSVEYRLAPEYPWPTAVFDCWDVCAYLTDAAVSGNAEIFGKDVAVTASGFIIAGASAGANLACAVLSMSLLTASAPPNLDPKWNRQPLKLPIRGIYIGVPFIVVKEILSPEYEEKFTSRQLDPSSSHLVNEAVRLYQADERSPMFSPINLPKDLISQWPRTYIQVGDQDIWRDDGVIFEDVLRKHGAEVKIDRYTTLSHVTWSVYTTGKEMDIDSELGRNTMAGMKYLLETLTS